MRSQPWDPAGGVPIAPAGGDARGRRDRRIVKFESEGGRDEATRGRDRGRRRHAAPAALRWAAPTGGRMAREGGDRTEGMAAPGPGR